MKTKNLSSYTTEEIKAQLEEKQGLLKRMKFDHTVFAMKIHQKLEWLEKKLLE